MIAVSVLVDENHQDWQDHTGNDSGNDHLFHKRDPPKHPYASLTPFIIVWKAVKGYAYRPIRFECF
jgi:hypothetical protein